VVVSANAGVQKVWITFAIGMPNFGARFKVPAFWVDEWYQRCGMSFGDYDGELKSIEA
jgi:hypothetical protein